MQTQPIVRFPKMIRAAAITRWQDRKLSLCVAGVPTRQRCTGIGFGLLIGAQLAILISNRVPVFIDGGIRRGTDAFKALALGAKAVGIGRPYLWGLGAFGQAGVDRVIEILQGELKLAMGNCGTQTVVSFRQGCMNFAEAIGIVGCPLDGGRRTADENDIRSCQPTGTSATPLQALA
ncbi:MAG: hypothetical protein DMF76_10895 [Acidobacteria bacterium]|nr:MAG: hypothetical protein DMF76_10895 [Acidobacteriota bacterium]